MRSTPVVFALLLASAACWVPPQDGPSLTAAGTASAVTAAAAATGASTASSRSSNGKTTGRSRSSSSSSSSSTGATQLYTCCAYDQAGSCSCADIPSSQVCPSKPGQTYCAAQGDCCHLWLDTSSSSGGTNLSTGFSSASTGLPLNTSSSSGISGFRASSSSRTSGLHEATGTGTTGWQDDTATTGSSGRKATVTGGTVTGLVGSRSSTGSSGSFTCPKGGNSGTTGAAGACSITSLDASACTEETVSCSATSCTCTYSSQPNYTTTWYDDPAASGDCGEAQRDCFGVPGSTGTSGNRETTGTSTTGTLGTVTGTTGNRETTGTATTGTLGTTTGTTGLNCDGDPCLTSDCEGPSCFDDPCAPSCHTTDTGSGSDVSSSNGSGSGYGSATGYGYGTGSATGYSSSVASGVGSGTSGSACNQSTTGDPGACRIEAPGNGISYSVTCAGSTCVCAAGSEEWTVVPEIPGYCSQAFALCGFDCAPVETGGTGGGVGNTGTSGTTGRTVGGSVGTPLVLAFDDQPVAYTSTPHAFELFWPGSGYATDWPTARTPWLALDRDGNGSIDDGRELFGSMTRLSSGRLAGNGFQALAALDSNGDGVIDARDRDFHRLQVWSDGNGDRRSDSSELESLGKRGIVSISLTYGIDRRCDARGNCEIERAPFTWRDGLGALHTGHVVDIHLARQGVGAVADCRALP